MRNQIRQLQIQGLVRIAGHGLSAVAFSLSVVVNAGAVQDPQLSQQPKNQQTSPVKKSKQSARTLSASEISEVRELLDHLGYWGDLDAKGNDASLRHALIAFQKIEGRNRTGVLTLEEFEALRVAQEPQALETGYPHIEVDIHRQVVSLRQNGVGTGFIVCLRKASVKKAKNARSLSPPTCKTTPKWQRQPQRRRKQLALIM